MLSSEGSWGFADMLSVGKLPGAIRWNKFGVADTEPTWSTVFNNAGTPALYRYMDGPEQVKVASTKAGDKVGGTGCNEVFLEGRDLKGKAVSEIISMAGKTPVTSVNAYSRIIKVTNISRHGHDIKGNLYVGPSSATWINGEPDHVLAFADGENNQSQMFVVTVPTGYRLVLYSLVLSTNSPKPTDVNLVSRKVNFLSQSRCSVFITRASWLIRNDVIQISLPSNPFVFEEDTDFEIRGKTKLNDGNLSANASGYLVPNIYFGDYYSDK